MARSFKPLTPPPSANDCGSAPVQVTGWQGVYSDGGVIYASFWSGCERVTISMGPANAMKLATMIQRALVNAEIVPAPQAGKSPR